MGHSRGKSALVAVVATLAACLGAPAAAGSAAVVAPIPGLGPAAMAVLNSAPYAHASWAIQVSDADTGESLVSYQPAAMLEPASVTKTYSVGAAWLRFGPDHRIITPVVRRGKVREHTLAGDLILVAKGDIAMGGQDGPEGRIAFADFDHNDANVLPGATLAGTNPLAGLDRLARQIRQAGIRRVSGQVIVDDRLWETRDLGENDGPVSPIMINHNLIDVVTTPGRRIGSLATVKMSPRVVPWRLRNRVRTVAEGATTDIQISANSRSVITLSGTIARDSDPQLKVWHVADPASFARSALIAALRSAGVRVAARATSTNPVADLPSRGKVSRLARVAELAGLPLAENARYILKVSYNRGGQVMVCLLAAEIGSTNCDDGFPEMARLLGAAGIDPTAAALVDGSGLPGNYVSAASQVQLMSVLGHRPDAARWQATLPVLGVDGSLATVGRGSPAAGHVFAKTGTLAAGDLLNSRFRIEVKALGGYIEAASGRKLAFAIIANQAMFADLDGVFAANNDLGRIAADIYSGF